jgi:hypothetical protein
MSRLLTTIYKRDLADDPDPNVTAPDPSRIFPVSIFADNGALANRLIFRANATNPNGIRTSQGTFNVELYLRAPASPWIPIAPPIVGLVNNQLASAQFSGFTDAVLDGFLRMTTIVAPGATQLVQQISASDQAPVSSGGGGFSNVVGLYATSGPVSVRDVVYEVPAGGAVAQCAGTTSTAPAIGVVLALPIAGQALVQFIGEMGGFVGLIPGAAYFVSLTTLGGLQTPGPDSSNLGRISQQIGVAKSSTVLLIELQEGYVQL